MGNGTDPDVIILAPAEAHFERGQSLALLERWPEALAAYESAIAARPDYPEAWHRHAGALYELHEFEDALASDDAALRLRPGYTDALSSRGATLRMLNRAEEALEAVDRALTLDPRHWSAHAARGNALRSLGRIDEALATFDRALEVAPGNVSARLNRALCLLLAGDFERGWPDYEWRWKAAKHQRHPHRFDQPIWLGGHDVAGRTILVHAEQGFGDTLQFCRYATLLAEAGATVMLRAPSALHGLLTTLAGVSLIVGKADTLSRFDLHCPLLSLPLAFQTRLGTIPANVPYLAVPASHRRKWRDRLGPRRAPRIGLAWSGNPEHSNDANRSLPLELAASLLMDGAEFHCLQREVRPRDVPAMAMLPRIVFHGAELAEFSDTAALVGEMDLVISVDTAVLHLAGALGVTVWGLLSFAPDWRWLLHRADSPWYPTMRLFRQPSPGAWASMIAAVREAAGGHVAELRAMG